MVPEIVRIGVANARIKCVTRQRVEYLDEAGQECFVDLEECNRNYLHLGGRTRYVGDRALSCDPPWIEFRNNRRTRFEFESSNEAFRFKLQLMKVRWLTFDAT
jgi:hypothetical protein